MGPILHESGVTGLAPVALARPPARLVVDALRAAAESHRAQGAHAEALTVLAVALDLDPGDVEALWLLARIHAERGDRQAAVAALATMRALAPDDSRALLADFLESAADGTIGARLAEVEEAMCRNVDIGEQLFDVCVRVLDAQETIARAAGATVSLGPGWPVPLSPVLLDGVVRLYRHLPRVFNSTRFTNRYFRDQDTFMRYNGARLAALADHLLARIAVPRGAAVLDAGCGNGYLLRALVDRYGVEAWGFDNAAALRGAAVATVPGLRFAVGELHALPYREGRFALVVCTDVLEHLDEPAQALAELVRVAAPGGRIFVSVPDGRRDRGAGHIHFFSPEGLERLCRPYRHDPIAFHPAGLSIVIHREEKTPCTDIPSAS